MAAKVNDGFYEKQDYTREIFFACFNIKESDVAHLSASV